MNTLNRHLLRASWRAWLGSDPTPVGPRWLQLVWTLLFSAGCGLFFAVMGFVTVADDGLHWRRDVGWWHFLGVNLVVAFCIGLAIRALFLGGYEALGYERVQALTGWRRSLYFVGLPLLGVVFGGNAGAWLAGVNFGPPTARGDWVSIVTSISVATFVVMGFMWLFRSAAQRLRAEKRAAQAQLRLLQGQIEPHFLFNTLANIASLMDEDVPKARRMLERFTDYLRASLSGLREETTTLGGELHMAENYLGLMQARMEDRLRYRLYVPDALRSFALPPLLLQPLLENAIHHGLEPKVDGGQIVVQARTDGAFVILEVVDDGLGLQAPRRRPGTGMALDNLRARLEARYGAQASMELADAQPGTRVTLRLPLH